MLACFLNCFLTCFLDCFLACFLGCFLACFLACFIACFLASNANLLPGHLVSSSMPTEANFQDSLLSRVGGWVVRWLGGWVVGWGKIEIKAKLSPARAGAWTELGKSKKADHFFPLGLFLVVRRRKNCETHYRGEGLLFSCCFLSRSNMVMNIS